MSLYEEFKKLPDIEDDAIEVYIDIADMLDLGWNDPEWYYIKADDKNLYAVESSSDKFKDNIVSIKWNKNYNLDEHMDDICSRLIRKCKSDFRNR